MRHLLTFCLFVLWTLNINGQSYNVDSLVNVLEIQKLTNKERIELCSKIVDTYVLSDLEKASIYTEKGLKLAEKEDDKTIESKFNAYFGRIYNTKSSYDTALVYWEKALDLAIEAKDEEQEASANRGIGILYARQEKFIPALECFKKALSIYENTDNKQNSIVIMSNIATTYRVMENEERAVYYLEKAKNMAEEIDDAHGKMVAYTELGAIYHKRAYTENEQGNVERALEYELKAHEISLRLGNKAYQVSTSQALNAIYSNYLEDEDTALKYAEKSLQAARELGDPKMIIAALSALSTSYFAQKRYRECKVAALEGWEIDSTDINIGSNLLSRIILTDIALCDKDNAEVFFAKYKDLFTRHIVQNDREIIADMEVKYETEKKEMRIASLEKERQLYVWLGVAGALFVFALIIVLWQTIRNARKERLLIATRSVLDGEMRERARLSQDLHDRLSGNLSAVKMELANQAESLQNVRDKLDKCIREVREAAHDMMPSSLQFGMKVALEDFTAQFPDVRFHFFGKENRLEKRIEFVVYCCASELVTNAIRHSGAKHINVQLVQGEKHVALTVQDDGCGFDEKTATKGLGLQSIRNRVTSCNGKMEIFSSPNKGTETIIELKINS